MSRPPLLSRAAALGFGGAACRYERAGRLAGGAEACPPGLGLRDAGTMRSIAQSKWNR